MVTLIISGAQTGADRAALDFAIAQHINHCGWCPKGRLAEDGVIPPQYHLVEMRTDKYPPRTEMNVKESDGTIIFHKAASHFERGCQLTVKLCIKHNKPYLMLHGIGEEFVMAQALAVTNFIKEYKIDVLNVAGNRESKAPGIHDHVVAVFNAIAYDNFKHNELLEKLVWDVPNGPEKA